MALLTEGEEICPKVRRQFRNVKCTLWHRLERSPTGADDSENPARNLRAKTVRKTVRKRGGWRGVETW